MNFKKHYIVTLHGLRGNAETFGEFHSYVADVLKKIDPSYDYHIINWTYPVGAAVDDQSNNINWNPHSIADKFNQDMFLNPQQPMIPELGPEDKISLIAYSMGGQMAMTWYYNTMFNFKYQKQFSYNNEKLARLHQYLEKVENIIGLGPVYWGSIEAELGWTFLEQGHLSEMKKSLPRINTFCKSPEIQSIIKTKGFWRSLLDAETPLEQALGATCSSIQTLAENPLTRSIDRMPGVVLSGLNRAIKSVGNVSPSEMDHMRITSDIIHEMRIHRISHMNTKAYLERFNARWTNIIGVFPCLGKADTGATCNQFKSDDFKKINDQLVSIFSGHKRRETDGPVFTPGATADFLYYTESPGEENRKIQAENFLNTADVQRPFAPSRDIFVENMHATVVPAIDSLSGILAPVGDILAQKINQFDQSLGVDVVIMNRECAKPQTCQHPNFKYVIESLTDCQFGKLSCDQKFVNSYFDVNVDSDRYIENEKLKRELGVFTVVMNIRLPQNYKVNLNSADQILKYIQFDYVSAHANIFEGSYNDRKDHRVDQPADLYAAQIARSQEIMSSYAVIKDYADYKVIRAYFMGRAWPKSYLDLDQQAVARQQLEKGIPVKMKVKFPGLKGRELSVKVKPTYSSYVDFHLK